LILVDANLLLYAYHPRAEQHEKSRAWLEAVLSGPDLVRFAWLTLWAFLRIATNPRVFERRLSTSEAEAAISSWLPSQPLAFSSRGSGTGTSCVVLCATARPPARLSWTRSSLPSLLSTAPRSVRQIAASRGSLRSGGRTLSRRTVDPIQSTGGTCRPRNATIFARYRRKPPG
jgi:hypothetical protein